MSPCCPTCSNSTSAWMVGVALGWEVRALGLVAQVLVVWEVPVVWVLAVRELVVSEREVQVGYSYSRHLTHICGSNWCCNSHHEHH